MPTVGKGKGGPSVIDYSKFDALEVSSDEDEATKPQMAAAGEGECGCEECVARRANMSKAVASKVMDRLFEREGDQMATLSTFLGNMVNIMSSTDGNSQQSNQTAQTSNQGRQPRPGSTNTNGGRATIVDIDDDDSENGEDDDASMPPDLVSDDDDYSGVTRVPPTKQGATTTSGAKKSTASASTSSRPNLPPRKGKSTAEQPSTKPIPVLEVESDSDADDTANDSLPPDLISDDDDLPNSFNKKKGAKTISSVGKSGSTTSGKATQKAAKKATPTPTRSSTSATAAGIGIGSSKEPPPLLEPDSSDEEGGPATSSARVPSRSAVKSATKAVAVKPPAVVDDKGKAAAALTSDEEEEDDDDDDLDAPPLLSSDDDSDYAVPRSAGKKTKTKTKSSQAPTASQGAANTSKVPPAENVRYAIRYISEYEKAKMKEEEARDKEEKAKKREEDARKAEEMAAKLIQEEEEEKAQKAAKQKAKRERQKAQKKAAEEAALAAERESKRQLEEAMAALEAEKKEAEAKRKLEMEEKMKKEEEERRKIIQAEEKKRKEAEKKKKKELDEKAAKAAAAAAAAAAADADKGKKPVATYSDNEAGPSTSFGAQSPAATAAGASTSNTAVPTATSTAATDSKPSPAAMSGIYAAKPITGNTPAGEVLERLLIAISGRDAGALTRVTSTVQVWLNSAGSQAPAAQVTEIQNKLREARALTKELISGAKESIRPGNKNVLFNSPGPPPGLGRGQQRQQQQQPGNAAAAMFAQRGYAPLPAAAVGPPRQGRGAGRSLQDQRYGSGSANNVPPMYPVQQQQPQYQPPTHSLPAMPNPTVNAKRTRSAATVKWKAPAMPQGYSESDGSGVVSGSEGGGYYEEVSDERECQICMNAEIDAVCFPCGHNQMCAGCARAMLDSGHRDCPMCRMALIGIHLISEDITLEIPAN